MIKNFLFYFILSLAIAETISAQKPAEADKGWLTFFEKSSFLETSDYNQTIKYFQKLDDYSDYCKLIEFGVSPQGRKLFVLAVSKQKMFTSNDFKKSGKPLLLIMNGIHSGEINGKDASMILLREILVTKEKFNLIDDVNLLIIPVFNVDGHERRAEFNRINQIGPKVTGWRTTAQNYNLNRDFMKADAPEMKSFLKLFSEWLPDIFIDVHATDGADFQYHTTITAEKQGNVSPVLASLTKGKLLPYIFENVNKKGFMISPFAGFINDDPKNGLRDWVASPRFSNGYAAAQNRIGILIESHVRKTYQERVFSTKAVIESVLEFMNKNAAEIKSTVAKGEEEVLDKYYKERKSFPLSFKLTNENEEFLFHGIEYDLVESKITGSKVKLFNGNKFSKKVPYFNKAVTNTTSFLPDAYIIPKEFKYLTDILRLHGVKVDSIQNSKKYETELTLFSDVTFSKFPFESHFIPNYKFVTEKKVVQVKAGDYLIKTDQRTIGVLAFLLEPVSDESFVKWGMMNQIFEPKEYFEEYAMEPIARKMYESVENLRKEFDEKVQKDSVFANNPYERLNFFYKKSEYYDKRLNLYPIMKIKLN